MRVSHHRYNTRKVVAQAFTKALAQFSVRDGLQLMQLSQPHAFHQQGSPSGRKHSDSAIEDSRASVLILSSLRLCVPAQARILADGGCSRWPGEHQTQLIQVILDLPYQVTDTTEQATHGADLQHQAIRDIQRWSRSKRTPIEPGLSVGQWSASPDK